MDCDNCKKSGASVVLCSVCYEQHGAENAELVREIMVANNNEIALQADYAHAKAAEIKAKGDWMATAIMLGQAEEVNKQLKTENERLQKQICDGANALSVAEESIANLGTATKENAKIKAHSEWLALEFGKVLQERCDLRLEIYSLKRKAKNGEEKKE